MVIFEMVFFLTQENAFSQRFPFSKKETFFKKLGYRFYLKMLIWKTHHFHTKLPYQKPMLRQIEWGVQNGSNTKNGVLPVTTLYF